MQNVKTERVVRTVWGVYFLIRLAPRLMHPTGPDLAFKQPGNDWIGTSCVNSSFGAVQFRRFFGHDILYSSPLNAGFFENVVLNL